MLKRFRSPLEERELEALTSVSRLYIENKEIDDAVHMKKIETQNKSVAKAMCDELFTMK